MPLNFSVVSIFPHLVPNIKDWGSLPPKFKNDEDDSLAKQLLEFHELMHKLGIVHEDVSINLFMYSLEGDTHEWFTSLPLSSVSSFNEFHITFHGHCKSCFLDEVLFEHCCEEFESYIQSLLVKYSSIMN